MSLPSPKSPELSDKSMKYDRQLRLWGEHGQSLLETSQVCLINATAMGTEILKGIVLPGIGGFTIVDGAMVREEDLGCNFFLDATCINKPRSKMCAQFLQELNPDVTGDYVDESIEDLLKNNPNFLNKFDVIIGAAVNEKTTILLSQMLWDLNIPFVICRSVGMVGVIRIQIKEHCIVETHPDDKKNDLRLEYPFATLKEHVDSIQITNKTPWLIILYRYLEKWRQENGGIVPSTYKQKMEIKDLIRKDITGEQENYDEAIKAVNSSFGGGKPDSNFKLILESSSCLNLNNKSNTFWILARALRDFINTEGNEFLPLPGVLPDMTADSASYINLQNIYRAQALHDSDIIFRRSQEILKELDMSSDLISEKDAQLFCREAASLHVLRGSKIADEYERGTSARNIARGLETNEVMMGFYVVLRAMDRFQLEHGSTPGTDHQIETDTGSLKSHVCKLLSEWGLTTPVSDDIVHEVCRYGGVEIHGVSAFIGGCVAQEVIKIITKQYKPINNTFIYNGIISETAIFEL